MASRGGTWMAVARTMVPEKREDPRLPWSLPERPLGSAPGPGGAGVVVLQRVGAADGAGIGMAWGWRGHCVRGVSVCRPSRGSCCRAGNRGPHKVLSLLSARWVLQY